VPVSNEERGGARARHQERPVRKSQIKAAKPVAPPDEKRGEAATLASEPLRAGWWRAPVPAPLFFALVVVLAVLFSARALDDGDTPWHVATGRLIIERGVPATNTFSFTNPDYPWHATEWLFDALLYVVHQVVGLGMLPLLTILLVCATCIVSAATARRLAGQFSWIHLVLFALVLQIGRFRFVPRPQLVSYLFLALVVYL
jgi:hypothetical protein